MIVTILDIYSYHVYLYSGILKSYIHIQGVPKLLIVLQRLPTQSFYVLSAWNFKLKLFKHMQISCQKYFNLLQKKYFKNAQKILVKVCKNFYWISEHAMHHLKTSKPPTFERLMVDVNDFASQLDQETVKKAVVISRAGCCLDNWGWAFKSKIKAYKIIHYS